jgi:hypothetical protein
MGKTKFESFSLSRMDLTTELMHDIDAKDKD